MAGAWAGLVSNFQSFVGGVGTFFDNNTLIADAVNGALFGAVTTAIGGGDILKGAAWGAAGKALAGTGDDGIFGTATNEIGGAIAGYGIAESMDQDGLIGAAIGGAYEHFTQEDPTAAAQQQTTTGGSQIPVGQSETVDAVDKDAGKVTDQSPDYTNKQESHNAEEKGTGGQKESILASLGLTDSGKDGSLLGKILVGAATAYGGSREREDQAEDAFDRAKELQRERRKLDEEFQQRNFRAFKSNTPFVTRNG